MWRAELPFHGTVRLLSDVYNRDDSWEMRAVVGIKHSPTPVWLIMSVRDHHNVICELNTWANAQQVHHLGSRSLMEVTTFWLCMSLNGKILNIKRYTEQVFPRENMQLQERCYIHKKVQFASRWVKIIWFESGTSVFRSCRIFFLLKGHLKPSWTRVHCCCYARPITFLPMTVQPKQSNLWHFKDNKWSLFRTLDKIWEIILWNCRTQAVLK